MIKISACVIVKNEEKNINRWLACVHQVADEVIVVDTGSTDATVQLAEIGGAKVYFFPWCDDFSAAKNFALEQAHGEWVIFLDADEYFPKKSIHYVRESIQKYHPNRQVLGFVCRLFDIDQDEHNRFMGAVVQIRIFRNLSLLRYQGCVHETLHSTVLQNRRMQFVREIEIYHTGYSSQIIKKKLERNLSLLQSEIIKEGEKPEHALYFMDCYYGLGEYDKAIENAQKALDSHVRFVGREGHIENTLVNLLIKKKKPHAEIFQVIDNAMEKYPESIDFPLWKGILYWDEKDYLQTEVYFNKGLALKDNTLDPTDACMLNRTESLWPYVYEYLGLIAQMKFEDENAFAFFWQSLEAYPYNAHVLSLLYPYLAKAEPTDIIQILNGLYDKQADAAFLADTLQAEHAGAVYLYYAKLAGQRTDMPEAYMAIGRYDAAVVKLTAELEGLYRLGIWSAVAKGMPQDSELSYLLPTAYHNAWKKNENPALCYGTERDEVSTEQKVCAVLQQMQREYLYLRAQQNSLSAAETDERIQQAVKVFEAGEAGQAVAVLRDACREQLGNTALFYSLAYLLQLDGQKEAARNILLEAPAVFPEMKTLWDTLHDDSDYPLVSIMIPTYNRPAFFKKTLESAVRQSYTNLEIIVCDNSTDERTAKIMETYQNDLRVRYIRNRDAKSKADNFAPFEKLARGHYLQWLMDDDILLRQKVASMVQCLQEHPEAALATSERGYMDAEGKIQESPYHGWIQFEGIYAILNGQDIGRTVLKKTQNFLGEPSAVLFRRKELAHHYWRADCRGYRTISDVVMWLELLEKGQCAFFREPLSYYRQHAGQEGKQTDVILLSRIEWYHLIEEYYARGMFLLTEADYKAALRTLLGDAAELAVLEHTASADMWMRYQICMKKVGGLLGV